MLAHSVTILIHGGNKQVLHPGQVVSGTVEYKAPAGERLVSLTIDFRGVTKIMPKKGAKHIDTEYIELFHMGETLMQDPFFVKSGEKYKWDFTFVLPSVTGPDRSVGIYKDSGDPRFEERLHTLPPSLSPSDVPETKIEYNLYAVAKEQFQGQGLPQMEEIQTRPVVDVLDNLMLRPDEEVRVEAAPHVLEKTFESTGPSKRRFSLTGATSNGTSIPPFTLIAKIPAIVIPGEDIDVELSVRRPVDGAPEAAEYTHKITTLQLEAVTHRRTAKTPYSPSLDIKSTTKFDSRKAARPIPIQPAAPLHYRFSTDGLRAFVPTFKSYSLARAYHLRMTTTIVHGKHEFEAVWSTPVVLKYIASSDQVLLRRASTAPPPPAPAPEPWERRQGVEDDLPPAYTPRTRRTA